jgi:hypothetical protein
MELRLDGLRCSLYVPAMSNDPLLRPATRDEVSETLSYALRFNRGKPHRMAQDAMARLAADVLVDHLEMAGFVLMRKAATKGHSTD